MEIIPTPLEGAVIIKGRRYPDERGWFTEAFNPSQLQQKGLTLPDFVQDNLSFSKKGVVRGLHLQLAPHGQAKLVTVLLGSVVDVIVDLRKGSPTLGQSFHLSLSGKDQTSLYIPAGFAHGFAALEDTHFFYKCSAYYHPTAETGIRWNDSELNIEWPVVNPIVSTKDQQLPTYRELIEKSLISQHV